MFSPRRVTLALTAALVLTSMPACRSANPYAAGTQQNGVDLVVRNDNFADMDLYAVADGLPTRIGTVTGNSTQRFELSESMYRSTDLRIVGTPIGGNGRASSGPIQVGAGQTIYFSIAPVLRQSSVSVR
jgi:hypothetical protein